MNNREDRNYDAFFQQQSSDKQREDERSQQEEHSESQDRPAYYAYGSYQSDQFKVSNELSSSTNSDTHEVESIDPYEGEVEITQPAPIKPMHHGISTESGDTAKRKRATFRSLFASFAAGAAVVALLVFVLFQTNLLTVDGAEQSSANMHQTGGNGNGISSGAAAAADQIVRPATISEMVKMAGPAVVKIETMVNQSARTRFNDDIFNWFFGNPYVVPEQDQGQLVPGGMGSGFIFDKDGYIYTNQHVVDGAREIWVEVQGYPDKFKAELLGSDYEMDLAILKIEGSDLPTLKIGDSSNVEVGDWVTAIGNPIGFDHTVSVGVLSAKEREISIPDDSGRRGNRNYQHLLQTDASINPGNSGGPLLNLNGEVIGMNTAVSANAQGIGFAIPSNTLLEVVDRLKNGEKIEKPFIGVTLAELDERLAEQLGLETSEGVVVVQVLRDSPANLAGLRPYDVIVEFDGETVENVEDLQAKIAKAGVGSRATLTFVRDGSRYDTGIIIGDRNQ